jgi:hypothetical protein
MTQLIEVIIICLTLLTMAAMSAAVFYEYKIKPAQKDPRLEEIISKLQAQSDSLVKLERRFNKRKLNEAME